MKTAENSIVESDPILLDSYLRESLLHLRELQTEEKGLVSAVIVDEDRKSFGVPTRFEESNKWYHAERNAVRNYFHRYGELPSESASIAISLSPCTPNREGNHREGCCCSSLLLGKDKRYEDLRITRIHIGFVDPWQVNMIEDYINMGFEISITKDPILQEGCKSLFKYFSDYYGENKFEYINKALKDL